MSEKTKKTSRCREKDLTEDMKQKPKEQKKTKYTEEKPSVKSTRKEKPTKNVTEEIDKQQRTPTENKKATVQGAEGKKCGGRTNATEQETTHPETPKDATNDPLKTIKAKTPGRKNKLAVKFAEETKVQPQTQNNTTNASVQITKRKTCAGKIKPEEENAKEKTKTQPETPQDTTKASIQTAGPKTCAGKAKKCRGEATKMQPDTLKDTTEACVPQDRREDKAAVDSILRTTLEKLKIKRNDRSDAAEVVNSIKRKIIMHLKQNTECFKEVEDPLHTGSYYENLKISNPDEFDVMLPIPVGRVKVSPFGSDGAFYSVALKRGRSPLQKFEENGTLSGSKMLNEFRAEVKKSVKQCKEWIVTKKKQGCPAVTLTTKVQTTTISLDVVLSLVVKSSWPPFTKEGLKIVGWLGTKVKRDYKRNGYYLVPKYEGRGMVENDGVFARDVWRISFSHIEKAILMNHGSEKTCCEKGGEPCCRKDCLKLLKHLLSLLKERHRLFDKFCSYHVKTTLLHACCSRTKDSDWRASSLSHCFQLLLDDFIAHLESGVLNNFFIPAQNLLSGPGRHRCSRLAHCIREERDQGFPIFK